MTLAADADVLLGLSTQELNLDSQSANQVFAGPASGGATDPTFRALVDDDVPDTITLTNITQVSTRSHTSLTDIGTNTHAQIDTHISSDGSDHTYIDQDVTSGSAPTFTGTSFTGIPFAGLSDNANIARLDQAETIDRCRFVLEQ